MLFKTLPPEEEAFYRQWARENYDPFAPINGVWHPIVQAECVRMNEETGYGPRADVAAKIHEDTKPAHS